MAATKTNRAKENHPKTIASIRARQLLNRLTAFALNEDEKCVNTDKKVEGQKVEMSAAQVTAALGVVKKAIPDLSATTFDGRLDANVTLESKTTPELDARIAELEGK